MKINYKHWLNIFEEYSFKKCSFSNDVSGLKEIENQNFNLDQIYVHQKYSLYEAFVFTNFVPFIIIL